MDTSRREFLKGCAAASFTLLGAGGCSTMPTFGSLRKDETLVAILSDCHVGNWNSPKYQGKKFAECVARILALDPLPAKMLIPGDLAYLWGRKEDYELSCTLLLPVLDAGIEVTIGMGNHDRRENFLERWPEYADRSPVPGRIVSKVHGVYFDYIMADTLDQPEETDKWITPGTLDDAQREWLKAECAASNCHGAPSGGRAWRAREGQYVRLGAEVRRADHGDQGSADKLLRLHPRSRPPVVCYPFVEALERGACWADRRPSFDGALGRYRILPAARVSRPRRAFSCPVRLLLSETASSGRSAESCVAGHCPRQHRQAVYVRCKYVRLNASRKALSTGGR